MDFWNKKDLRCPPVLTFMTKDHSINLREFRDLFTEAEKQIKNIQDLKIEAALLSRCIYRMKSKFGKDKGIKAMEKVNKALLICLELDLVSVVSVYKNCIPVRYETETHFPVLNLLDYILVRLQGYSKLLVRIVDTCEMAALYLGNRVLIGQFWKVAFMIVGTVSRLSFVCKLACEYFCKMYDSLIGYRGRFRNVSSAWLPADYTLPRNLKTWLDVDWSKKSAPPKINTFFELALANSKIMPTIDLNSDSDVEYTDEYLDIDNVDRKLQKLKNSNNKEDLELVDIGVVVNESIDTKIAKPNVKLGKKIKKKLKQNKVNFLDGINSMGDVEKFIKSENLERKKGSGKEALAHLDKVRWKIITGHLETQLKIARRNVLSKNIVKSALCKSKDILLSVSEK